MNNLQLRNMALVGVKQIAKDIIGNISNKIQDVIADGELHKFAFDANYILENQHSLTKEKVTDYVIEYFRNRGIRIRTKVPFSGQYPIDLVYVNQVDPIVVNGTITENLYGEFDNSFSDDFLIYIPTTYNASINSDSVFLVEWFVNDKRESMKHYA